MLMSGMKANSDLGLMIPNVRLYHNKEKFVRYYENHYGKKPELFDTEGQMFYVNGEALVLMTFTGHIESELSLLVHEAYHVAVAHIDMLGEDDAGEETMAYLVQSIANGLFKAHRKWRTRKGMID